MQCLLFSVFSGLSPETVAGELNIGLFTQSMQAESYAEEWTWALRGGGAQFQMLGHQELAGSGTEFPLVIVDSVPMDETTGRALENWVHAGGLLIYAGVDAALKAIGENGEASYARDFPLSELLGANFSGFDEGLIGIYPQMVVSSELLSPLKTDDALRLGKVGIGHSIRIEAKDATVLARGVRLSPGQDGIIQKSFVPTILTREHGQGRVIFLTFSPGQIAHCYAGETDDQEALDCTGASQAHALMRWLTANLLWEERQIQLPLLWEAPGDRPHAVIVTGDVHHNPFEVDAAVRMGKRMDELALPLSLYLNGQIAPDFPEQYSALQRLDNLEVSPHSSDGEVYWTKRFRFTGALGILLDLKKALSLLEVPEYPSNRDWLISIRNESWQSDRWAWWAMEREGVGLVFDHIADTIENRGLYLAPNIWFEGGEEQKIFVPIFERSIATPVDNFRLEGNRARNMASLSSAQAEPCCIPLSYSAYTRYVERWHTLFGRLAAMGGLTEVWLWHPGGVALKHGFADMVNTLRRMKRDPAVFFLRGDVVASWRYNRELSRIQTERDAQGQISKLHLTSQPGDLKPMPPGSPSYTSTTSYWVLAPLNVPGWESREWSDPMGRPITVLTHPTDTR